MSDFSNKYSKKEVSFVNSEGDAPEENYSDFIEDLITRKLDTRRSKPEEKRISFKDAIAEKEKIRNIGRRQYIELKKKTLDFLRV